MQLKNSLLLVSALSAGTTLAMPTLSHRHLHDAKRAVGDLVTAVIDGKVVHWANTYDPSATTSDSSAPAPAVSSAAATSAAAAVPSYTPSTGDSSSEGGSTLAKIMYKGNTGTTEYGDNFHIIDASETDSYPYKIRFINQDESQDWFVGMFNKIGRDGHSINAAFEPPAKGFTLAPGQAQWVGIDANSQGFWGSAAGSDASALPRNLWGQLTSTWGEFDVANSGNQGYSGFDISVVTATDPADLFPNTSAMKICDSVSGACSKYNANIREKFWDWESKDLDGLGCDLGPGDVSLDAYIAWNGQ